jgi:tetratricopeptide (TPR) repeat protein
LLGARAQIAIASFQQRKHYQDAIDIFDALIPYLRRTAPNDYEKIAAFYYGLGITYLAAHMPNKAEPAFQTCLNIEKHLVGKNDPHTLHVIMIERFAAIAQLEKGNLKEAITLGHLCVDNHAKYIAPTHLWTAGDYLVLASMLAKNGNSAEAVHYYTLGLGAFTSIGKATASKEYDAGQSVACEGLVQMGLKTGNLSQVNALRNRLSRLGEGRSNWPAKIDEDTALFFGLWGHFPSPTDPILSP